MGVIRKRTNNKAKKSIVFFFLLNNMKYIIGSILFGCAWWEFSYYQEQRLLTTIETGITEIASSWNDNNHTKQVNDTTITTSILTLPEEIISFYNATTKKNNSKSLEERQENNNDDNYNKNSKKRGDVAIVLFTHLATMDRMERYIFPALETFHKNETEPFFIVLSHRWKDKYENEVCANNSSYSNYCRKLRVLWVDCPEGQFGESPCCKQEKGLVKLLETNNHYDWTLFGDDDMYFRWDFLKKYLTQFLKDQVNPSSSRVIITANGNGAKLLGQYGYLSKRKSSYLCSDDYRYPWGQPVIYTWASLRWIQRGLELGGLVKQCKEYDVTHDVGNAVFHWMYGLSDYAISVKMFANGLEVKFGGETMGIHGIHRFRHDVNKSTMTMHEVHTLVQNKEPKRKKYMKQLRHRPGYNETETYHRYGHPSKWNTTWHTMPKSDCMSPQQRMELQRSN